MARVIYSIGSRGEQEALFEMVSSNIMKNGCVRAGITIFDRNSLFSTADHVVSSPPFSSDTVQHCPAVSVCYEVVGVQSIPKIYVHLSLLYTKCTSCQTYRPKTFELSKLFVNIY